MQLIMQPSHVSEPLRRQEDYRFCYVGSQTHGSNEPLALGVSKGWSGVDSSSLLGFQKKQTQQFHHRYLNTLSICIYTYYGWYLVLETESEVCTEKGWMSNLPFLLWDNIWTPGFLLLDSRIGVFTTGSQEKHPIFWVPVGRLILHPSFGF